MSSYYDTKTPEGIERYDRSSSGASFTGNFGRSMRDNPGPVALIGAGIGWLLLSKLGGESRRPRYTADDLYSDPGHQFRGENRPNVSSRSAGSMASAASDAAYAAGERVSDTAASVADGARRMSRDVGDRLSDSASAVGEYASAAGERMRQAGEGVRHGGERLWDASTYAGRSVSRAVEDQPLILGAVGLVVGAMIGAALPGSRTENRLFGSAADRVRSTAKSMARDGLSEAGHAASDAVSEVGRTLDEHGLSGRGLRETVGALGDTVQEAIDPNRREDQGRSLSTPGASPTSPPKSGNGEAERQSTEKRH